MSTETALQNQSQNLRTCGTNLKGDWKKNNQPQSHAGKVVPGVLGGGRPCKQGHTYEVPLNYSEEWCESLSSW